MVSGNIQTVTCPKCGETDDIIKFDKDIYIVRDENEFVRRKLYGCKCCENIFTYDSSPRKEKKNITNIQNVFSKLSKQCATVASGVTMKM